ncbi:MAG TPA: NAD(P)-dependent oxidoreductase [Beijerinckiaceae bacterium]
MADPYAVPTRIAVTGAGGNLGRKLIAHLVAEASWCEEIVALDRDDAALEALNGLADDRAIPIRRVAADLTDARGDWRGALASVDAVVHFAAQNPYPGASWDDACLSFDMTANLLSAAAETGVRRVVFASSNHVMGRYKDPPLADEIGPGRLTTALTPGPGTRWTVRGEPIDGVAYAASKLMGERACLAAAAASGGALTAVAIRIGWCQPGENLARTLNTTGVPGAEDGPPEPPSRELTWFRAMWLSNRDFAHLLTRALVADPAGWPAPGIVVNGMSANTGMAWDIAETSRLLGYKAQDDVERALREGG